MTATKLIAYTINPIPYPGVTVMQESALVDIAGLLKAMLGDKLHDSKVNKDGIEILVELLTIYCKF